MQGGARLLRRTIFALVAVCRGIRACEGRDRVGARTETGALPARHPTPAQRHEWGNLRAIARNRPNDIAIYID